MNSDVSVEGRTAPQRQLQKPDPAAALETQRSMLIADKISHHLLSANLGLPERLFSVRPEIRAHVNHVQAMFEVPGEHFIRNMPLADPSSCIR